MDVLLPPLINRDTSFGYPQIWSCELLAGTDLECAANSQENANVTMDGFKVVERESRFLKVQHLEGHSYDLRVVDHPNRRRTLSEDIGIWQNERAEHAARFFKQEAFAFAQREARSAGMID